MNKRGSVKIWLRPNTEIVWLRKSVNGVRISLPSGKTKKEIKIVERHAEALFWEAYKEKYPEKPIEEDRYMPKPKTLVFTETQSSLTFKEYGEYILSITSNSLKLRSKEAYEESFKKVCEFFGDMDLASIRASTIEEWQTLMLEHYAPATINRKLRTILSKVLEYAEADEIISKNPIKRVSTLKVPKREINTYTAEEIQKLLDVADEQFADLLRIAIFTGLRAGELIALKWSHIDFKNLYITVCEIKHTAGKYRGEVQHSTKGGYDRRVELLPQVFKALERQKRRTGLKGEYVFLNQYGNPYQDSKHIRVKLQKLLSQAGLKNGTLHDLRKTFVTLMLQSGQSESWLKQMVGHIDISVTQKHYIGTLKADVEKLNNILVS